MHFLIFAKSIWTCGTTCRYALLNIRQALLDIRYALLDTRQALLDIR
jgi:hypothetical protein